MTSTVKTVTVNTEITRIPSNLWDNEQFFDPSSAPFIDRPTMCCPYLISAV